MDTVSLDEESIKQDNEFPKNEEQDDEYFSNHDELTTTYSTAKKIIVGL